MSALIERFTGPLARKLNERERLEEQRKRASIRVSDAMRVLLRDVDDALRLAYYGDCPTTPELPESLQLDLREIRTLTNAIDRLNAQELADEAAQ